MPASSPCPGPDMLRRLLQGELAGAAIDAVAGHLDACPDCAAAIAAMAAATTQHAASAPGSAVPPLLRHVMDQLLLLGATVDAGTGGDTAPKHADTPVPLDFLAPAQGPDEIGRLGVYRVQKFLGQGGMGLVLLGHDPELERPVALKVMLPALAASAAARQRFLQEARLAARLYNDHIVTIYRVSEDRGVPFLAMELLEGATLSEALKAGRRFTSAQILRIGGDIADGLAAAHDRGLVHRDIKPGNIWLEEREVQGVQPLGVGRAKILDFGLARVEQDDVFLTQSGVILGTPAYMAPEQARGEKVDGRADLWSLGVILYELATGRLPFTARSTMGILTSIAVDRPRPPHELNARLPLAVSNLLLRLLEKEPGNRPASAHEVATALTALMGASAQGTPLAPAAVPGRGAGRRRWLLLGALAAAVPALAAAIFFVVTPHGTVRVEVKDPRIEVQLGTGTLIVRGAGAKEIAITPGANCLHIERDGFAFDTRQFALGRGDRLRFSVEYLDGRIVVRKDGAAFDEAGTPAAASPPRARAPFDAATARAHQETWARHLGVPVDYENSIGMKFILIPPGEFLMGSTPAEIDAALAAGHEEIARDPRLAQAIRSEGPPQRTVVPRPFYLSVHELTQQQFAAVMGRNPARFSAASEHSGRVAGMDTANYPVESASWNDYVEFCAKLSQQEKLKPFYIRGDATNLWLDGTGYRLPTEAEWEFACRAGTATRYWSGDREEDLAQVAWYRLNAGGPTHAVGGLKANPFGLYDMLGNVAEFVEPMQADRTYFTQLNDSPAGAGQGVALPNLQASRGGSYWSMAFATRCAYRWGPYSTPDAHAAYSGFRPVLAVAGVR